MVPPLLAAAPRLSRGRLPKVALNTDSASSATVTSQNPGWPSDTRQLLRGLIGIYCKAELVTVRGPTPWRHIPCSFTHLELSIRIQEVQKLSLLYTH